MCEVIKFPRQSVRRLVKDMYGFWFVSLIGTDKLQGPYRSRDAATAATGVH